MVLSRHECQYVHVLYILAPYGYGKYLMISVSRSLFESVGKLRVSCRNERVSSRRFGLEGQLEYIVSV